MSFVWVAFVLIFTVVQLCTAEYVVYGRKMTLDDHLSLNPNRCHHPLITQLSAVFASRLKNVCVLFFYSPSMYVSKSKICEDSVQFLDRRYITQIFVFTKPLSYIFDKYFFQESQEYSISIETSYSYDIISYKMFDKNQYFRDNFLTEVLSNCFCLNKIKAKTHLLEQFLW